MSGRAAAVRNRLLVALAAVLLALLFGWSSDEGLLLLLLGTIALALAVMRAAFGGVVVLAHWLLRYRAIGLGLRELGDIIGEHADDMQRAGLVVPRRRRPTLRRPKRYPRQLPDRVPRMRHRAHEDRIVVTLEAVRAGMSQDDIVRAVPRLRSAWGVDVIHADVRPGGRLVELTIPIGAAAERAPAVDPLPSATDRSQQRPPDAPPVSVVQGSDRTGSQRTRPPSFRPAPSLQPDEHGRYELTMLPLDAARTFAPRGSEERAPAALVTSAPERPEQDPAEPRTDEIPVLTPARQVAAAPPSPGPRPRAEPLPRVVPPSDVEMPTPASTLLEPGSPSPTDIDERSLRLGPQWRTGKRT